MKILTPTECATLVKVCSSGHEEGVRQILALKQRNSVKFSENAVIYFRNTKYTFSRCLKIAAGNGFLKIVKMLLADSRLFNVKGHQEAFRIAVTWGRMEVLKILFKHPRVNPAAMNNIALHTAVNAEHSEAIRLLLTNEKVLKGTFNSKTLYWAIKNNEEALVEYILNTKAIDPTWNKNAPLKAAIELGNPRIIYMLMKSNQLNFGVDANSAIIQAAFLGHLEVVDLLRTRADVNPADRKNYAVHLAAINGHADVVRSLVQDPRVIVSQYEGDLTLLRAVRANHYEVTKVLLATSEFNPRAQNHLLLKWAIYHQDTPLLRLLLSYHISKKRIDPAFDQDWAIRTASALGNVDHLKLLLLDKDVNPGAHDNEALFNASANGHPAIVQLLLNMPKVKLDKLIQKPLSVLAANQTETLFRATNDGSADHVEIVQILLKDGRFQPGCKNNAILKSAAQNGFTAVVQLLVKGARKIECSDLYETFKLAADAHHLDVIRTLLIEQPTLKTFLEENPSMLSSGLIFSQDLNALRLSLSPKVWGMLAHKQMKTTMFLAIMLNVPLSCFTFPPVVMAKDFFKVVKLKSCQDFIAGYQQSLSFIKQLKNDRQHADLEGVKQLEQDIQCQIQVMITSIAEKLASLRQVMFFVDVPIPSISITPMFTQIRRFGLDRDNSYHTNLPDNVLNKIMKYIVDERRIGAEAHECLEKAINDSVNSRIELRLKA